MSVNLYRDLVEVIDYITNCFPSQKMISCVNLKDLQCIDSSQSTINSWNEKKIFSTF